MDRAHLTGCLLSGAIVAAPFLALLYDAAAGLAVMTVALGATAYLAGDAARGVIEPTRRRLLTAATVNALLAAACVAALIARLA